MTIKKSIGYFYKFTGARVRFFESAPAGRPKGSSLLVVLGILSVIFIFGFGYANYLNGQVYFLEREKDYEAARLIIKSAFTETLYLLNYDNSEFIKKLQNVSSQGFSKPFDFYQAKVEASKRLMKKIFEKYDNPSLKVWLELIEPVDFKISAAPGEKFARFKLHGQLNAGIIVSRLEYEVIARLSKIVHENRGSAYYIKLTPERIFAVIAKDEFIEAGRYYGICVYTGMDQKQAKKAALANEEFKALLVNPNGSVIVDKALPTGDFCLTFGPAIAR
ncbi:MAG TPA: hypothetical protein PKW98_07035 [Candidatus Wallbacteria bacterium]|nr:hypothetical protein [Candidatus Wallbacteria bacterium]